MFSPSSWPIWIYRLSFTETEGLLEDVRGKSTQPLPQRDRIASPPDIFGGGVDIPTTVYTARYFYDSCGMIKHIALA